MLPPPPHPSGVGSSPVAVNNPENARTYTYVTYIVINITIIPLGLASFSIEQKRIHLRTEGMSQTA